jgi:hypothetical protein
MSKGTTDKPPTLFDAIQWFLGPMHGDVGRLIDDWAPDAPVTITFGGPGGYQHKTTMGKIQDLDRAYMAAHDAKMKRSEKKSRGTLL